MHDSWPQSRSTILKLNNGSNYSHPRDKIMTYCNYSTFHMSNTLTTAACHSKYCKLTIWMEHFGDKANRWWFVGILFCELYGKLKSAIFERRVMWPVTKSNTWNVSEHALQITIKYYKLHIKNYKHSCLWWGKKQSLQTRIHKGFNVTV